MRLSVFLLLLSLAGVLFGGWLIARWALGLAVVVDSTAVAVWALRRDDGTGPAVEAVESATPADVRAFIDRVRGAA